MADPRIIAAATGGYLLGRSKRGRKLLSFALKVSGKSPSAQAMSMARTGLTQALASDEAGKILEQLRGPIMEAAQKAALQRLTGISNNLAERTAALSQAGEVAGKATDAAGKTADTASGVVGSVVPGGDDEDSEDDEASDEAEDTEESEEPKPEPESKPKPKKKAKSEAKSDE